MRSNVFSVWAPPFAFGLAAAGIPSFLGGATPFNFRVTAESVSAAVGPIEGLVAFYDEQERWTSRSFAAAVEVVLSNRSAFAPKTYFKSLTANGQTVRGRWYASAHR